MASEPSAQRWSRIRAERRVQILVAASRVFAREGIAKPSMAMVAAECAATKVTVYAHFRSKNVLVTEVLQQWMAEVEEGLRSIGIDTEDHERLFWRVAEGLKWLTQSDAYQGLSRAMQREAAIPQAIRAEWEGRFRRLRSKLTNALALAGSPDADAHADAFLALLDGIGPAQDVGAIVRLFLSAKRAAP